MRSGRACLIVSSLLLAATAFLPCAAASEPPPLGLTARAEVTNHVDGDTLDMVIHLPVRVRLLDAWAPEPSEPGGEAATEHLKQIAPVGSEMLLHVPSGGSRGLLDVMSFGRVLAHLWAKDAEKSVSEQMVESGHATEDRP